MKYLCLAVILVLVIQLTECYKILGLFPYPGKSHYQVFKPLLIGLSEKGHNVTVISHYPLKSPKNGFRDISLLGSTDLLLGALSFDKMDNTRISSKYLGPTKLFSSGNESCRATYEQKEVKDLLQSDENFDLIITEIFNTDCMLGFLHKFPVPVISMSSCFLPPWFFRRFGATFNPSYTPNLFMDYPKHLSFHQRVESALVSLGHTLYYNYITNPNDNNIISTYFGADVQNVEDLIKRSSLVLVNSHFSLTFAYSKTPNIIEIGGLHVGKPKSLAKNIGRFVNESENGIIYFSLGSLIKGHTFPEEKRKVFLKVFSKLSQRVLWKWENDSMPDKPANVMTQKWMPQLDILCDPNVKAYIGHGGLLGTTEAVHCGVPMVVMPQFGDQFLNAKALEESGGGIILKLQDANEKTLTEALRTVLTPAFQKRAKDLSARFKDRPLPPLETAIYWVEYVARHKGASFMRTAAVDMPWYQVYLLDVLTFLAVFSIVIIAVVVYTLKKLLKLVFSRKANIKEKRH